MLKSSLITIILNIIAPSNPVITVFLFKSTGNSLTQLALKQPRDFSKANQLAFMSLFVNAFTHINKLKLISEKHHVNCIL